MRFVTGLFLLSMTCSLDYLPGNLISLHLLVPLMCSKVLLTVHPRPVQYSFFTLLDPPRFPSPFTFQQPLSRQVYIFTLRAASAGLDRSSTHWPFHPSIQCLYTSAFSRFFTKELCRPFSGLRILVNCLISTQSPSWLVFVKLVVRLPFLAQLH